MDKFKNNFFKNRYPRIGRTVIEEWDTGLLGNLQLSNQWDWHKLGWVFFVIWIFIFSLNDLLQDVEANTVRLKEHGQDVLVLEKIPTKSQAADGTMQSNYK